MNECRIENGVKCVTHDSYDVRLRCSAPERDLADARAKAVWCGPWQEGAFTYQEAMQCIAAAQARIATLEEEDRVWDKHSLFQIVKERRELRERVAALTEALLGVARTNYSQVNEPCWCDTIAGWFCVGQPRCEVAYKALTPAKETT